MANTKNQTSTGKVWQAPAIEWEETYRPVVFAASCTQQPFNCGAGARE
jgi:hypothetical protein